MALTSTLYRFHLDLSDIDRGVYETLDFRVAMHPSESFHFLLTRILAYALNFQEGLEFTPGGLSDPDQPALQVQGQHGAVVLWIEIGSPSAKKLHRGSKAARQVKVYTYKDAKLLLAEIASEKVHQAEKLEIYSFSTRFLDSLTPHLERDNEWSVMVAEGTLTLTVGEESYSAEILRHS